MKQIFILIVLFMIIGCASNYGQLRRAENASARIGDYALATTPAGNDELIGTDIDDTTMSVDGTTKRYRLQDLPISTLQQAALDDKQDVMPGVTSDGSNGIEAAGASIATATNRAAFGIYDTSLGCDIYMIIATPLGPEICTNAGTGLICN